VQIDGLTAAAYIITSSDDGGTILNGSIVPGGITFSNPEVVKTEQRSAMCVWSAQQKGALTVSFCAP
jgi:hypothetical protein